MRDCTNRVINIHYIFHFERVAENIARFCPLLINNRKKVTDKDITKIYKHLSSALT